MTFNPSENSRIKWAAIELFGSQKLNLPRVLHQSAWEKLTFPHYSFTIKRYALRGDQWEPIKDLLPQRAGTVGVAAKDNRLFVEVVLSFGYSTEGLTRTLLLILESYILGVWQRVFEVLSHDSDN